MTTKSAVAYSDSQGSKEAGEALALQLLKSFPDREPDVLVVFSSSKYDYVELLTTLQQKCKSKCMLGCSSPVNSLGEKR